MYSLFALTQDTIQIFSCLPVNDMCPVKLRKEVFRLENMITEETPFVEALRANIADPKVHEASEVAQQKRSLSKKTLALQATIRSLSSERDALLAKFDEA
eukprot:m.52986 g.52986  ORF g.52986 m.52986 type:complete len:100 (+) comp11345_c1_seq1:35-334(+)